MRVTLVSTLPVRLLGLGAQPALKSNIPLLRRFPCVMKVISTVLARKPSVKSLEFQQRKAEGSVKIFSTARALGVSRGIIQVVTFSNFLTAHVPRRRLPPRIPLSP